MRKMQQLTIVVAGRTKQEALDVLPTIITPGGVGESVTDTSEYEDGSTYWYEWRQVDEDQALIVR